MADSPDSRGGGPPAAYSARTANLLSSDLEFDSGYDETIQGLSKQHWTPVRVAMRAAHLLSGAGATRILDIGSGVGKFCIVGALSTGAEFVGIERRRNLVKIATRTALRFGADRARFVHASADTFPFDGFNGVYLYNPFFEQVAKYLLQIDGATERSLLTYAHFIGATTNKLAAMPGPVAVVTYNGFGGRMPAPYAFQGDEPAENDSLELWVKK